MLISQALVNLLQRCNEHVLLLQGQKRLLKHSTEIMALSLGLRHTILAGSKSYTHILHMNVIQS